MYLDDNSLAAGVTSSQNKHDFARFHNLAHLCIVKGVFSVSFTLDLNRTKTKRLGAYIN
jgi:hypothetical protein